MQAKRDVFEALKAILQPYATQLDLKADTDSDYYLDTKHIQKNKKPLFFAAVQVKKNYVSYYLMPVYVNPNLLEGISEKLKHRMQGKSCFNFKGVDQQLFEELAELTQAGFASYREQGFV
jgi:hypothetical protein